MGNNGLEVLRYGDESVLMARRAEPVPVWVGSNRCMAGYQAIENDGANLLILDDGFQHLALERDLDIVLLDAANPFGNGSLLPLGPLREPPMHLDRADAILLTRAEDPEKCRETRSRLARMLPRKRVFSCTHRLTGLKRGLDGQRIPLDALRGRKVVAFSGIARPESFTQLLRKAGIVVSRSFAFSDHYRYLDDDMVMLLHSMKESDTPFLLTTEKDMVRLRPEFQAFALAAGLELDFAADHQAFCDFLQERLPSR
jgi:tetraacyldisaccharide 4'-kinase